MLLPKPLTSGTLLQRYKRFLADVQLESGDIITVHCPNSGSMQGCAIPGSAVLLSRSEKIGRKYAFTWELVRVADAWVGINTSLPNHLVREGIEKGIIEELQGYQTIRPEVRYGANSRIDLLLSCPGELCYVEVKNVTLVENNLALFPDAPTVRGQKHLRELMEVVRHGYRAVNFFVVQHAEGKSVSPADAIDPEYGRLLRQAAKCGVEILAYQARITESEIILTHKLPVIL